jgi:tetratricopeptide (TPR) repeat protein
VDRIEIRIAQARNYEMVGRHAEAMDNLEEAFNEPTPADLKRRAVIQRARGWVAYLGGLLQEAEDLQREAMEIAIAAGDGAVIASVHSLAGNILRSAGKEPEAEASFSEAIRLRRDLGEPKEALGDVNNLGILALRRDPERAHELFTKLRDETSRLGDDHLYATTLMNLAILEKSRGDWNAAEKCYRVSIDVGEHIGVRGLHRAYMNLGNLLTDRGEFEEARTCLDRASLLAAGHRGKIPVLFVELNRARLELRRGLPEQALEIADRAAPGLTKKHLATWINLHMYRSQALAELGRFDEAEQAARIASESAQSQDDETFKG